MTRRMIGILGGMGPLATVDLYQKIIRSTPARTDQEHIPVVIYADPTVPDRTAALLEDGEDPTAWLIHGAGKLADSGADFLVMPCNTAHAFLPEMRAHCRIPIIDMIDESARAVREIVDPGSTVGILATSGTIGAGLYQEALDRHGLLSAVPDEPGQERVMETIHQVKSGTITDNTVEPVKSTATELERNGARALLAACTELPVVLTQEDVSVPLVDPTDVLARAAIRAATDESAFNDLSPVPGKAQSYVL